MLCIYYNFFGELIMTNIELIESIYLTYFDEIKNYLKRNLSNKSILEDITQEVFTEFFRLLSKEE